eukprot:TRINITY_DN3589_c0_g1_i3.p1 TRINITY_DN3589_c0_g1~~TRINITY_DN3589_c0_g1_i3.p1  ORF type:complete len:125 (+),score=7.35 TRINITY_DN3589_c0_g1_i3:144-518(+)
MCIRDRYQRRVRGTAGSPHALVRVPLWFRSRSSPDLRCRGLQDGAARRSRAEQCLWCHWRLGRGALAGDDLILTLAVRFDSSSGSIAGVFWCSAECCGALPQAPLGTLSRPASCDLYVCSTCRS